MTRVDAIEFDLGTARVATDERPRSQHADTELSGRSAVISPLTLQRAVGNRATTALLQRDTSTPSPKTKLDWAAIEVFIKKSGQGVVALAVKDTHKVVIDLTDSGAASFMPDSGHCRLNATMSGHEIASYFVHEMHHAKQFYDGKSPDPIGQDEKSWVALMVKEEIDGTVKGFEAKLEMEKNGAAKNDVPPFMNMYRSAYEHARKTAIAENKSEADAHAAGLANGSKMTTYLIKPGDKSWPRLAPSQLESYEMYYTREWRKKNLPR